MLLEKPALLGKTPPAIMELIKPLGLPAFRTKQIYEWLHKNRVQSFSQMSNLSKELRETLETKFTLGRDEPISFSESSDGTKKYLYKVFENKFIETAYIPEPERATLCVSTQVGCKMGCLFCATARQGFQGNLSSGQIVNQLFSLPEYEKITNIVYMGMGEPLDNADNTFESLRILTDPAGHAMSSRRITLSTIGILEPLKRFISNFEVHLAISIHSPFDEERRKLMPIQQVYPIKDVIDVVAQGNFNEYRKLSFEYIMFDNVNESPDHAKELVRLLNGLHCKVNLIHYHSVPGNDLQGSTRAKMEEFQNILKEKGLFTTIRRSRGEDIQAACGLLSTKALLKTQEALDY